MSILLTTLNMLALLNQGQLVSLDTELNKEEILNPQKINSLTMNAYQQLQSKIIGKDKAFETVTERISQIEEMKQSYNRTLTMNKKDKDRIFSQHKENFEFPIH